MKDKVAVITGANSGIGKALVKQFLIDKYQVALVCRNEEKGQATINELTEDFPQAKMKLYVGDLSEMKDVVDLSHALKQDYRQIDILMNNAGVILTKRTETSDGFEKQLAVNYFAPVLLSWLLASKLEKSNDPRIVIVSSGAHKAGKLYQDDFHLVDNYSSFRAYGQSKLAVTMMTSILGSYYDEMGIALNCYHPGAVATNISVDRNTGARMKLMKFLSLFFITPEEGARTGYYLAHNKSARRVTGAYFYKEKPAKTSKYLQDDYMRKWLLEKTIESLKEFGFEGP